MFAHIAEHYDLMNRVMSVAQDKRWRRQAIDAAELPAKGLVLDLGTGTGDLAAEIKKRQVGVEVIAGDFTMPMMLHGKKNLERRDFAWVNLDAHDLPFASNTFERVVSGYLMRNVHDIPRCWREQHRVLKPGGRATTLDTTAPPQGLLALPIHFYLKVIIPFLGWVITGEKAAYTYLPESTRKFLKAEDLALSMHAASFTDVGFSRFAAGTMAIHWGSK